MAFAAAKFEYPIRTSEMRSNEIVGFAEAEQLAWTFHSPRIFYSIKSIEGGMSICELNATQGKSHP
ncbi:Uncharacterised protein [Mycobacterium tuberculosis]|nr:Uncharacterised protein [Mycobacterium tuberculosis]